MNDIFALALGSLLGGFARYYRSGSVHRALGAAFPYGTLAVNLVGCFLIGFLVSLADKKFLIGPHARLLLMTGFCGAFTTFSTFILETGRMVEDGQWPQALLNVTGSVLIGFFLFRLGALIGEWV